MSWSEVRGSNHEKGRYVGTEQKITATKQAEEYLAAMAKALEIPQSRYEQAERSYKSVGSWLERDASQVQGYAPETYIQGSFKLGTATKPETADEQYDIDCVCNLRNVTKMKMSQAELKALIGDELELYRKDKKMNKALQEGRRCWTLEYADEAQFHMDIVPAIPNESDQRALFEAYGLDAQFADTAIAITDNEETTYHHVTRDWPRSNPRGYAEWFKARMGDVFVKGRQQILNEMRSKGVTASVEDIPVYRVRTPLQSAIMILKRHRDTMFADDPTDKPISIILSTLAAHAYNGETTIGAALMAILVGMEEPIKYDGVKYTIANPTDGTENFADKWEKKPERKDAFYSWLAQAREDFAAAANLVEHRRIGSVLSDRMGSVLAGTVTASVLAAAATADGSGHGLVRDASQASTSGSPQVSFGNEPRVPDTPDGFA